MQEIKLFGRYVIRPDNGKTWAVSDILTNKDKDSENFEKEYEYNSLGFSICNLMWNHESDKIANSPELRQCLSQSGTIWQGGECVIILNK